MLDMSAGTIILGLLDSASLTVKHILVFGGRRSSLVSVDWRSCEIYCNSPNSMVAATPGVRIELSQSVVTIELKQSSCSSIILKKLYRLSCHSGISFMYVFHPLGQQQTSGSLFTS